MSHTSIKILLHWGWVLIAGLILLQGCGKVEGDYAANKRPTVALVNVPPTAADSTITQVNAMPFTVAAYNLPVNIFSMSGAELYPDSTVSDSGVRVFLVAFIYDTLFPPDTITYEFSLDYTINFATGTLTAFPLNTTIQQDTFALPVNSSGLYIDFAYQIKNYYVFSYAPTVHWVGYDEDGFIDHYEYADCIDTSIINAIDDAATPGAATALLNQYIATGAFDWQDTTAMEARVYLLTEEGDTTEHLFLVRAYDNSGDPSTQISEPAFKFFFRSNNAPNNPQIKPLELAETEYTQNFVVTDTLFCLDNLAPLWAGLAFNWRATDPDDKELIQIPLEFTYYLVKTPGDTIWSWSDSTWTDLKQIAIFGLESGNYLFSVWTRDDAYTQCAAPATITFNVVRPTFEHHILLVNESEAFQHLEVPNDSLVNFWMSTLSDLQGQLDHDNFVMDGVDVRYLDNTSTTTKANCPIPYNLIGQYKLVIFFKDSHGQSQMNATYVYNRTKLLGRYLDVGGRIWYEGRRLIAGAFLKGLGYTTGVAYGPDTVNVISATGDFLGKYMQLDTAFPADVTNPNDVREFVGGIPLLSGLDTLQVDPFRVDQIIGFGPFAQMDSTILMDVDWFTRTDNAVTVYTYNSVTADPNRTEPYVYNEDDSVASNATPVQATILPGPLDRIYIDPFTSDTSRGRTIINTLISVSRVINKTKGDSGQVISKGSSFFVVSYPFGEPWEDSDSLEVDYVYDPTSQKHQKPVAIRYEAQPQVLNTIEINGITYTYYTFELGYRTAFFAFPLYFVKNDQGQMTEVVREMLNWFFYPTIHWQL